jgi:enoyl-CoA hydratase
MNLESILVRSEGPVATVSLNRPDALNAITPVMLDELIDAFAALGGDGKTRVVILTGEGRAFSAGVDLKSLHGRALEGGAVGDFLDGPARRLIEIIRSIDAIVIAAVNGFCFTGALELALATDIIVVAEEAVLADTHAKFGLRPTWGMSQRLPAAVGLARARMLSYTGRQFTGLEARDWGLAALACPRTELVSTVQDLAQTIVENSPGSLRAYKDLYRHVAQSLEEGLAYEASNHYEIEDTEGRVGRFR